MTQRIIAGLLACLIAASVFVLSTSTSTAAKNAAAPPPAIGAALKVTHNPYHVWSDAELRHELAAMERAHRAQLVRERREAAARRASRAAHRRSLITSSAAAWAHSYAGVRVANCESGGGPNDHSSTYDGDAHLRDPNGHDGKWQFAPTTWWSVGGHGNAADASEVEQDYRAWLLWTRDGWGQWECASLTGVA